MNILVFGRQECCKMANLRAKVIKNREKENI